MFSPSDSFLSLLRNEIVHCAYDESHRCQGPGPRLVIKRLPQEAGQGNKTSRPEHRSESYVGVSQLASARSSYRLCSPPTTAWHLLRKVQVS